MLVFSRYLYRRRLCLHARSFLSTQPHARASSSTATSIPIEHIEESQSLYARLRRSKRWKPEGGVPGDDGEGKVEGEEEAKEENPHDEPKDGLSQDSPPDNSSSSAPESSTAEPATQSDRPEFYNIYRGSQYPDFFHRTQFPTPTADPNPIPETNPHLERERKLRALLYRLFDDTSRGKRETVPGMEDLAPSRISADARILRNLFRVLLVRPKLRFAAPNDPYNFDPWPSDDVGVEDFNTRFLHIALPAEERHSFRRLEARLKLAFPKDGNKEKGIPGVTIRKISRGDYGVILSFSSSGQRRIALRHALESEDFSNVQTTYFTVLARGFRVTIGTVPEQRGALAKTGHWTKSSTTKDRLLERLMLQLESNNWSVLGHKLIGAKWAPQPNGLPPLEGKPADLLLSFNTARSARHAIRTGVKLGFQESHDCVPYLGAQNHRFTQEEEREQKEDVEEGKHGWEDADVKRRDIFAIEDVKPVQEPPPTVFRWVTGKGDDTYWSETATAEFEGEGEGPPRKPPARKKKARTGTGTVKGWHWKEPWDGRWDESNAEDTSAQFQATWAHAEKTVEEGWRPPWVEAEKRQWSDEEVVEARAMESAVLAEREEADRWWGVAEREREEDYAKEDERRRRDLEEIRVKREERERQEEAK